MIITDKNDERNWSAEPVRRDKSHLKKRAAGPPRGNQNAVKHGLYSYKAMLNGGGLDHRTSLYQALMGKEKELATSLGGDPSPQEQAIIADTVKTMLYIGSLDAYLTGLKSLVRKGRVHCVLSERTRLAGHLRENLKTLGLKRVARDLPDLARALQGQAGRENETDIHALAVAPDMVHQRGDNGGHDGGEEDENEQQDEG